LLKRKCIGIGLSIIGADFEKHGVLSWSIQEILKTIDILAKMGVRLHVPRSDMDEPTRMGLHSKK
jgi:hypothetical protein